MATGPHEAAPQLVQLDGTEAVGVIEAVGPGVGGLAVGDRVLWGVGLHESIVKASFRAIMSALNRADRDAAVVTGA